MKSYTDIKQSKKLAEILPIESADMSINHSLFHNMTTVLTTPYKKLHEFFSGDTPDTTLPCWSLAALLEVIPKQLGRYTLTFYWCDDWCCSYIDDGSEIKETSSANNPVDATVEMIVKLKEKDLL